MALMDVAAMRFCLAMLIWCRYCAGKRLTLSTLDPVNMEDVPPAAVRLGAGELGLRIAKERRRQKAGLGSLVHRIPRRRMEGKPGESLLAKRLKVQCRPLNTEGPLKACRKGVH